MLEFALHPGVYHTGTHKNLLEMLETIWIKEHTPGKGTIYLISGYSNYNGGVHFYSSFKNHTEKGGKITALLSGSTTKRLSSIQAAEALLDCNADVYIVNRKNLLHAKCYGTDFDGKASQLIVTSGNFTGYGMSQNGESSLKLDKENIEKMNFSWDDLVRGIFRQGWNIQKLDQKDRDTKNGPGWKFLYDETKPVSAFEDSNQISMLIHLSRSDTLSIQALPGSPQGLERQYFQLSPDAFAFLPPLNHCSTFSGKHIYSTQIHVNFINTDTHTDCPVTFEGGTAMDFRLGIQALRSSKIAGENDLALLSRAAKYFYELRIIPYGSPLYNKFLPFADKINHNNGRRYGYMANEEVIKMLRE